MDPPVSHPGASPEQVLRSGSHTHLLVDLLVDASPPVLQLAALSLGKRITSLQRRRKQRDDDSMGILSTQEESSASRLTVSASVVTY